MANNVQLRSVAILPVISDARILKERYLRPTLEACLGTYGLFKVEHWPQTTETFLDLAASALSHTIREHGKTVGAHHAKKFDEHKTRFSPEMISEVWQHVNEFFRDKIGEGWAQTGNAVPGLAENIHAITLSPISEQGRRIFYSNTQEKITNELRSIATGIRTHDFFTKARTLMFYSWALELGLYEKEQPELRETIRSELQSGRK